MLTLDTIPILSKDVLTRTDSGGVLLFQFRTDEMHYISKDADAIFRLCNGARTMGELMDLLAECRSDLSSPEGREQVERFIEDLASRSVVELWR